MSKIKIDTTQKGLFANPFSGNAELTTQAFRRWLWKVHQGEDPIKAAMAVTEKMPDLQFNRRWRSLSRESLMNELDGLLSQIKKGVELTFGTQPHVQILRNYLNYRLEDAQEKFSSPEATP